MRVPARHPSTPGYRTWTWNSEASGRGVRFEEGYCRVKESKFPRERKAPEVGPVWVRAWVWTLRCGGRDRTKGNVPHEAGRVPVVLAVSVARTGTQITDIDNREWLCLRVCVRACVQCLGRARHVSHGVCLVALNCVVIWEYCRGVAQAADGCYDDICSLYEGMGALWCWADGHTGDCFHRGLQLLSRIPIVRARSRVRCRLFGFCHSKLLTRDSEQPILLRKHYLDTKSYRQWSCFGLNLANEAVI